MLTVLFATRNGAKLLPEVLRAYTRLTVPEGGWRLVIVDNASSDATPTILRSFATELPLTLLHEKRPGKNAALNRGLEAIAGDLVILTDDDVFPHADWLLMLRRAADAHPEASLFGGRIVPRWEEPPADWITRFVPPGPVFTLTEPRKHVEGPVIPDLIFGPNMAIRAAVFAQGFRFDESIGPNGANYAMGSESEFTQRLARAGFKTWFCENAVVEHFIRTSQLNRRWILERSIRYGRGRYRLYDQFVNPPPPTWFGVPRYFYREAINEAAHLLRELLAGTAESRFRARWDFNVCLGRMLEARRHGHLVADAPRKAESLPSDHDEARPLTGR